MEFLRSVAVCVSMLTPRSNLHRSSFSQAHNISNSSINNVNIVFPYSYSFLLHLHHMMLVNGILDALVGIRRLHFKVANIIDLVCF